MGDKDVVDEEILFFQRWCWGANNHVAVDAVNRWRNMKPSSRAALFVRWKAEDAKKKEEAQRRADAAAKRKEAKS